MTELLGQNLGMGGRSLGTGRVTKEEGWARTREFLWPEQLRCTLASAGRWKTAETKRLDQLGFQD